MNNLLECFLYKCGHPEHLIMPLLVVASIGVIFYSFYKAKKSKSR